MPRYVSYIRVSTKGQEVSGLGLEAQESMIRRHVETTGGSLVGEYREAESGKNDNRPALREALARCKAEKATLLIPKLDRLARRVHFISGLMESGVDFVACDMPSANRLTIHIMAAVAEEEARAISARTKAALQARRERGLPMGSQCHQEGLSEAQEAHLKVISGKGADVVRDRARQFNAGVGELIKGHWDARMSLRSIADWLNADGHRTARGLMWNKQQVKRVLNSMGIDTGTRNDLDVTTRWI